MLFIEVSSVSRDVQILFLLSFCWFGWVSEFGGRRRRGLVWGRLLQRSFERDKAGFPKTLFWQKTK